MQVSHAASVEPGLEKAGPRTAEAPAPEAPVPEAAAVRPGLSTETALPPVTVAPFPEYSRREVIADLCIHIAGLTFAMVAIPFLLVQGFSMDRAALHISLPLYAVGLLAMLSFSALYNLVNHPPAKEILRRFDHSAIFFMIAGSYGPFALGKIGGAWGIGLFVFVWTLAIVGTALAFLVPRKADRITVVLCLLMGWSIVVAIEPLMRAVSAAVLVLLLIGGLIYSAGVVFHLAERLRYHNALWHACVLVAAMCHYAAVMLAVG